MTTVHRDHLADEFRAHLPAWASRELIATKYVANLIDLAVSRGWTTKQLAEASTRNPGGMTNVGGVITSRLEHCTREQPPTTTTGKAKPRPFCTPDCATRAGWIEDERGRPIRKCDCRSTP